MDKQGIPEGYEVVGDDNPPVENASSRARRQSIAPSVTEFGLGVNKGITELVGLPGDLVDLALGTDRFGSKALRRGIEDLGMGTTPDPNSMAGYVGEAVGGNLAATGPLLAAVKTGATFAGPFTKYFKEIADYVKTAPMKSTLLQLGLSGPQGVGGYTGETVGRRVDMPATGRFAGETAASLGPIGVLAGTKWMSGRVQDALNLSAESRRLKARDLFEGSMSRPGQTTEQILGTEQGAPKYGTPTTGELTNDPGLMAQQRDISRRSEIARGRSQDFAAGHQMSLREGFGKLPGASAKPEDTAAATAWFRKEIESAAEAADREINAAVGRAKNAIMKSDVSPDEASKTASEELMKALKKSDQTELRAWNRIGSPEFNVTGIKEAARQVIAGHPKTANPSDIHPVIYQISGEKDVNKIPTGLFDEYGKDITREAIVEKSLLNDRESFANVQALASRLKASLRLENANGNFERARNIRAILDAMPDNAKPMTSDPSTVERWEMARAYTKSQHDVFTRGPIGKVMGYDPSGGTKVPVEMTLERLLQPGTAGKLGFRALKGAGGSEFGANEAEITKTATDYLIAKFSARTLDTRGNFSPEAAETFVRQHPVLEEIPQLRAAMLNAKEAELMARTVEVSAKQRAERVANQSVAAFYTKGEPAAQAASILRDVSPTTTAKELMAKAKLDPSGQAVKGVQGSFYEVMMARVAPDSTKDLPVNGMTAVDPKKLRAFISNYNGAILQVWGVDGLNLLNDISRGATMGARIARGVATGGGSPTTEQSVGLLRHVVGSMGSLIGEKLFFGSHPLVAAGAGRMGATSMANRFLNAKTENVMAVLEQALYDPEFARSLLTHPKSHNVDRLSRYGVVQSLGMGGVQSMQEMFQ